VGKENENPDDYLLIEEVASWAQSPTPSLGAVGESASASSSRSNPFDFQSFSVPLGSISQKILKPCDSIILHVANWNGQRARFVLRKKGSVSVNRTVWHFARFNPFSLFQDPSSRAWITTITKKQRVWLMLFFSTARDCIVVVVVRPSQLASGGHRRGHIPRLCSQHIRRSTLRHPASPREQHGAGHCGPGDSLNAPQQQHLDHVCPQVLAKARRAERALDFVLVEELAAAVATSGSGGSGGGSPLTAPARSSGGATLFGLGGGGTKSPTASKRALTDTELVFGAQSNWKTNGRFVLRRRDSFGSKVYFPFQVALESMVCLSLIVHDPIITATHF